MAERLSTAAGKQPSTFATARDRGEHYTPPANTTEGGVMYAHAVQTILVQPEALYKLWRDVETIPLWQEHVVSVTEKSAAVSHWVAGDPEKADGARLEWDSEIVEDVPGEKIRWKSITKGIDESGTVTFRPHLSGRGTVVTLDEQLRLPGGAVANAVAGLVERSPRQTVIEDLRHFKELAESGEIPSVKGQAHGPRGVTGKVKEWMFGETNPTPAGSSDSA